MLPGEPCIICKSENKEEVNVGDVGLQEMKWEDEKKSGEGADVIPF